MIASITGWKGDGAEHGLLGELLRVRLDHQHAFLRAGEDEVKLGLLQLLGGRVEDVLAVDIADSRPTDRPHEWDAGNRQSGRGANHRHDIGIVFEVVA
jgi:hypothetical protein